jgi:chitosanase
MRFSTFSIIALAACGSSQGGSAVPDELPGNKPNSGAADDFAGGADLAVTNGGLTPNQKAVAEALTSIWENNTPVLDYAYSENIHDGNGYTSGRAGFCTGTGDAIQVVDCYDKLRTEATGNLMAKYMPALITINNQFMSTGMAVSDTRALDAVGNWNSDWGASYNTAATQDDFKQCQDQIVDLLYYTPAMDAVMAVGLKSALTRAALYDMWINQGDDQLVKDTNGALGQMTIGGAVTEDVWLKKFLELRLGVLVGDSTWKSSVDRVAAYEKARRRGNWDLSQPVDSAVKAKQCWPSGHYLDSGYSVYVIQPDGSSASSTIASSCQ